MVDQRDDHHEDFIINGNDAQEAEDMDPQTNYESSSEVFQKKPLIQFVIGAVALIAIVVMLVVIFSRPDNEVDPEYLQSLETRMQQLEKRLATIGVIDQTIEQLGKQEQAIGLLDQKLNQFESTVTTQIDQIIKELGKLHQKIARKPGAATPSPRTAEKKRPAAAAKTESTARFHQVQAGETLYRISLKYGLSVDQLRSYNDLASDAAIYPGQKLKLSPNG